MLTHPPTFKPLDYSWARDPSSPCLTTTTVKDGVKLIPDDFLKIICCGCYSEYPCKTQRCVCTLLGLACSIFRECEGYVTCCKPGTQKAVAGDKNIEEKERTE